MNTLSTAPLPFRVARGRMTLQKGALLSVPKPRAHTVECVRGLIWITHDHEPHDIILSPGQTHLAQSNTRMLVQGLEQSEVHIHALRQQSRADLLQNLRHSISAFWAMVSLAGRGASASR